MVISVKVELNMAFITYKTSLISHKTLSLHFNTTTNDKASSI